MIEILKKQWFVALIALILVSFFVFVVYDTNKDKLPGKTADGNDVVASITDKDFTANDLFDAMDNSMGDSVLFMYFQNAVIDASVEADDEMKEEAKTQADALMANAKQQEPTTYKSSINAQLKSLGFEAGQLEDYMLLSQKRDKLLGDYMDERMDELFTPIYKEKKSRLVSHILVKMEDANNPTDEEKAKIKKIEDELKSGKDFAEVAKENSDDVGSAEEGGNIGYVDSDSPLVKPFLTKVMGMKKGETSSWVKVTADDSTTYQGWHMIKVVETDRKALQEHEDAKDGIHVAISTANEDVQYKALWEASKKLEVTFADDSIKKRLLDYMGIKE